ncbi:MAG: hypothetical protein RL518_500 [Pseudomonadota bacterium]|jgi:hypothetical protein
MRLSASFFAAILLVSVQALPARADYQLPLESSFTAITNFFVTGGARPSTPPLSVDEVPHPMASVYDHVSFEGRLDGLFCKRFIKERKQRDCVTCCGNAYRKLLGHDGLAKYSTDLKEYYLVTCQRNCAAG